jgi:lysyl-tRNA synthetase class 1
VAGGRVKVGWKVDWALRWFTLGVHYEMYGKDLIESADLSRKIMKVLGAPAPVDSFYEMFLDETGSKISKSVGKGLTVETWLTYAPRESMLLFLIKNPRKAKKLSWDVVARTVDEYLDLIAKHYQEGDKPDLFRDEMEFVWPDPPAVSPYEYPVSYTLLFTLMANAGIADADLIAERVWNYRSRIPGSDDFLRRLIAHAAAYYRDHVEPHKKPAEVPPEHVPLVLQYAEFLETERTPEEVHHQAFLTPREAGLEPGPFFRTLYRVLSGQDQGPRLGPFVKMIGQARVAARLREAAASRSSLQNASGR